MQELAVRAFEAVDYSGLERHAEKKKNRYSR